MRLHRIAPKHVTLYAKVESFNPGGSVKDRLALAIVLASSSALVTSIGPNGASLALIIAQAAQALAALAGETKLAPGSNLGVDPIGLAARGQESAAPIDQLSRIAAQLGARTFVVDGTAVHDQGASDAQELGYVLAAGVHYLRRHADFGIDPAQAAQNLEFRLAATAEQFPTIAKFRAGRLA